MLYGKLLSCKVKNAPRGCTKAHSRACLKKAFRELRVPVCGRFYPNKGGVAGYGNRMRVKYTAKWSLQIAEMIFQVRSKTQKVLPVQWAAYPDILFYPLEDQARLPFITLPFLILNFAQKAVFRALTLP